MSAPCKNPPARPVGSAENDEPVTHMKLPGDVVLLVVPPDALDVLGGHLLAVDMARRDSEGARRVIVI
jgi:hypothetical protein